jgi:hypothetical protein
VRVRCNFLQLPGGIAYQQYYVAGRTFAKLGVGRGGRVEDQQRVGTAIVVEVALLGFENA